MRGACLIVVLCSGVVAGSPKSLTGQALALEVRGGVTRSHVASDYAASGPRRGGEVGVGVDVTLRSWLGVRAEVGYAEAGALGPGPFQLRMGYLTVPIAVRLSAPTPRLGLQPYVTAGVTPAREVQCRGRTVPATIVSVAAPPTVALNCQDLRTERFEVRGTVGLGAYVGQGRVRYVAEVRHVRGVTDLAAGYPGYSTHHRALSVLVGMSYRR